ncbi:MAG: ArsC/Spx/MgsR family protein [Candidatus Cloacimonadales bacterium]|jgi:arsenate reductase-like glutaredoxin family protein|nr:ArsC family transcriptional regulator [Candidatus Cloacimonadota bacterium]MDD3501358.1 ArsC family transcriptional regulator [Candidatus Cloacimonadota bacterium]MDX9977551.1 ArsC/Spx/MgsR family protein [Candidatus Cloacimonadales bacterium]
MIQIIGTKKCRDTQKVIRYLKERGIDFQFKDLQIKGLSLGEITKISQQIPIDDLIDKNSKEYEKLNLKYIIHDKLEKLLAQPLLFKTPIIRKQNKAFLGFDIDMLEQLLQ